MAFVAEGLGELGELIGDAIGGAIEAEAPSAEMIGGRVGSAVENAAPAEVGANAENQALLAENNGAQVNNTPWIQRDNNLIKTLVGVPVLVTAAAPAVGTIMGKVQQAAERGKIPHATYSHSVEQTTHPLTLDPTTGIPEEDYLTDQDKIITDAKLGYDPYTTDQELPMNDVVMVDNTPHHAPSRFDGDTRPYGQAWGDLNFGQPYGIVNTDLSTFPTEQTNHTDTHNPNTELYATGDENTNVINHISNIGSSSNSNSNYTMSTRTFKRTKMYGREGRSMARTKFASYNRGKVIALKRPASRKTPKAVAFVKQLRALCDGKTRDAVDVLRTWDGIATEIQCLTSAAAVGAAASANGLIDATGDSALMNNVRIKGKLTNASAAATSVVDQRDILVRHLVVFFHKPKIDTSAAGTLPPLSEVLALANPTVPEIEALPVQETQNKGRFTILSDKLFNIGTNVLDRTATFTYLNRAGPSAHIFDYTVKIDKKVHFLESSVAGGTKGGHYDSDVKPGQVNTGLLVLYQIKDEAAVECGNFASSLVTRLNYTA